MLLWRLLSEGQDTHTHTHTRMYLPHTHTHKCAQTQPPQHLPPHQPQGTTEDQTGHQPTQTKRYCPGQSCRRPGSRHGRLRVDRLDSGAGTSPPPSSLNLSR